MQEPGVERLANRRCHGKVSIAEEVIEGAGVGVQPSVAVVIDKEDTSACDKSGATPRIR